MSALSYPDRHRALCGIIDELPDEVYAGSSDVFASYGRPSTRDVRAFKLDAFLANARSRKGKEVERVDELRLSERDFENLGQVGDGQFGTVCAVRCKVDNQVYAMKSIKKFAAARAGLQLNLPLERHIHILAHQEDTHMAPGMVAAFQNDPTLHLITTYAPHGTLWDRMCSLSGGQEGFGETSQAGRMAEDEVRWWAGQMVASIAWIHDQGFVHRDIKPHNFLLQSSSRLLLTDFGSAAPLVYPRSSSTDPSSSRPYVEMKYCQLPIGTPDYIAPEVLRLAEDAMLALEQEDEDGSSDSDPDKTVQPSERIQEGYGVGVDWWSLGATVYEMATGQAPFYARAVRETYQLIVECGEGTYLPKPIGQSPRLRSFCLSFFTPSTTRLGSHSAQDVKTHSFFAGIDWSRLSEGHPPDCLASLPTIEFVGHGDYTTTTEATFDHFFQSSPGFTTMTSSCSSDHTAPNIEDDITSDRWCGWTWIPSPDDFRSTSSPLGSSSDRPVRPLPRQMQGQGIPVTPARSTAAQMPSVTPRSTVRKRPVSDKRAMAELVKCVQHSARKRASSVKPRPSSIPTSPVSAFSEIGGGFGTPTPKARTPVVEPERVRVPDTTQMRRREGQLPVDALAERQVKLMDGLAGLENRFSHLKTKLQAT